MGVEERLMAEGMQEPPRSPPHGGQRLDVRVPATPSAVAGVRRALGRLDLPSFVLEDARLLVSELVTNSVRHAGLRRTDEVRVLAEWSGRRLRVDVHDGGRVAAGPAVAGAIRPSPGSDSGWGLYLVDRLASRWGRGRGRHWFELEVAPGRRQGYRGGSSSRAT